MTKAEIVRALKKKAGLATLAQAEAAYESLFAIIKATLKNGDAVSISGFGGFKVVQRKARKGRKPRTGKEIRIPVFLSRIRWGFPIPSGVLWRNPGWSRVPGRNADSARLREDFP